MQKPGVLIYCSLIVLTLARLSESDCGCGQLNRKNVSTNVRKQSDGRCEEKSYKDVMEITGNYPKRGKMVFIKSGHFYMGTKDENVYWDDGEHPERTVYVNSFYMDETEVTNEAFAAFVEDTNYVTLSEQFNNSMVFVKQLTDEVLDMKLANMVAQVPWWAQVELATWASPHGPGSSWKDLRDHPVVHVSWMDAVEYCKWAGKRLPTEAEWEYACRAGKVRKKFPWGNKLTPMNKHWMNVWQGEFPNDNTVEDGFKFTSPVRSYPNNSFGLYDMTGNVWEWVADWFTSEHGGPSKNPVGPSQGTEKVKKGGSFLCHKSYCHRYRCSARHHNTPDTTASNLGFRCIKSLR